ncbi:response regulator [Altererythrobacter sp. KTW20L]|uniref:response regulator n=1 Tax=Altererythrobacter sp. KTW20L TaxID=2942210 RepID=UPI0020C00903|nr:response regulator [Altererythrobacter sp. KTW20L]MCL6251232.1 response regulator [Altererythrobacter sp. KTW20L]
MPHALIIDDNIAISRAIRSYLEPLGFETCDQTRNKQQALDAAARRKPDIIVIGDDIETGSAIDAARRISCGEAIPVLMVSGDPTRASKVLQQASSYDGPFHLNQIEEAVEVALSHRSILHRPPVA